MWNWVKSLFKYECQHKFRVDNDVEIVKNENIRCIYCDKTFKEVFK